MPFYTNFSLHHHNTFGLDVRCAHFAEYWDESELFILLLQIDRKQKLFHLGEGSNVLFKDNFQGTILHSAIKGTEVLLHGKSEVLLRVGSGEHWDDFVAQCVAHGFYGLENLSLIPGEVGAAAVQNIGAYGSEVSLFIEEVEVIDLITGEKKCIKKEDCAYAYRYSNFKGAWKGRYAVTYVVFRLSTIFKPCLDYIAIQRELKARNIVKISAGELRDLIIEIRKSKLPDPKELGNAGSFFMNPIVNKEVYLDLKEKYPDMPHYDVDGGVKIPAGWLIQQAGWKGKKMGPAAVYNKQALILVNCGEATGKDIINLADAVCGDVKQIFGIEIRPEVNYI